MKNLLLLALAVSSLSALCLTGCSSPAPEATTSTTPEKTTEAGTDDKKMGEEKKDSAEHSKLPADVKVAADGVVRNAAGKAYCVVMNEVVTGDEASMPSQEKDGVKYVFCCKQCPDMFAKNPDKYTIAKK